MKTFVMGLATFTMLAGYANAALSGCFQIGTYDQLKEFASKVNDGKTKICGEVTAAITASGTWTPMMNYGGYFDGHGYTISGLSYSNSDASSVGLFGSVQSGAIIKHVVLSDVDFTASTSVGGVVGFVSGTDVMIDSCNVSGSISSGEDGGGIVGTVDTGAQLTMVNSYNTASVGGNSNEAQSGLIGYVGCGDTVNLVNSYNIGTALSHNILIYTSGFCTGNPSMINAESVGCVCSGNKCVACSISGVDQGISTYANSGEVSSAYENNLTSAQNQAASFYKNSIYAAGKMFALDLSSATGFSGVTFSNTEDGVVATLSDAGGVLSIPQDVAVDTVVLDRAFDTELSSSTVMLPFEIAAANVKNAEFFNVTGVTSAGGTAETEASTIEAYKPYLVKPTQSAITFNGGVTLKQTSDNEEESYAIGDWSFRGRITNKTWLEADVDGKAYTYSPMALSNGIAKGKFAKIGKNVRVRTMRAYLYYTGDAEKPLAKPAADAMLMSTEDIAVEDLPSTIPMTFIHKDIIVSQDSAIASIEGEDNGTLAIEKISTQMPAISSDRWFDLKGRRLNGHPQTRGTYLHNKTLVTIK